MLKTIGSMCRKAAQDGDECYSWLDLAQDIVLSADCMYENVLVINHQGTQWTELDRAQGDLCSLTMALSSHFASTQSASQDKKWGGSTWTVPGSTE